MAAPAPSPADTLRLSNQLCFPVYAAANAVQKAYRRLLAPLGLTYPQYLVMLVLWERDGLSLVEIGRSLKLDSGTLTPLLKRMEAAGLVRRERSDADERVVRIRLTPAGEALREPASRVPLSMAGTFGLELNEAVGLKAGLEKLIAALERAT